MRYILLLVTGLLFIGCNTQKKITQKKVDLEYKTENGMLIGQISEEQFLEEPFVSWYQENYGYHSLDKEKINAFKDALKNYDIEVFMGTWCGDSKRETPAFFKILKAAEYPLDRVKMYAVNRAKESGMQAEKGKNITHVPTFIFYKNGKEAGRIVESPVVDLESDISAIVHGKSYTPNYAN